jgi:hypothetical protein
MGSLLMSQSPVFQTMFKNDYIEGQTKTVKITGIEESAMEEFIKWLHLGKADMNKHGKELFIIADRYQLTTLKVKAHLILFYLPNFRINASVLCSMTSTRKMFSTTSTLCLNTTMKS